MHSKQEMLQELVRKYQEAGNPLPAAPKEIARWAINARLWRPRPEAIVGQCADQIARAMSVEFFSDLEGNRIRAKHAVVSPEGPEQHVLWDDIRTGAHEHLQISFQQRRKLLLNQCTQLKNDVDYFNHYRNPARPVQMVFNFTLDLEEQRLAKGKERAA